MTGTASADGAMLTGSAHQPAFCRAIIMPNLVPPVVTTADDCLSRAHRGCAAKRSLEPLMTSTHRGYQPMTEEGKSGHHCREAHPPAPPPILRRRARQAKPACAGAHGEDRAPPAHGEATTPEVDISIEKVSRHRADPRRSLPDLKVTMEHVTTSDGIDYIRLAERNCRSITTTI
jgi:dihydroorotase